MARTAPAARTGYPYRKRRLDRACFAICFLPFMTARVLSYIQFAVHVRGMQGFRAGLRTRAKNPPKLRTKTDKALAQRRRMPGYAVSLQPRRAAVRLMHMKQQLRLAAVLAAAALAVAGCGSAAPQAPIVARGMAAREPAVDPRPYGAADAAFGLDALGAWCQADPRANLVLSPSSLASGLGMAYLGARGGTARAMAGVLHLPTAGGQGLEAGLHARSAALRGLDGPGVTVDASDQVWADPSLITSRGYLNEVATGYQAGVAHAPLLTSPDQAARQISQAIAAATRGHIPQLLPPGSLHGIGWVLTDAVYMQAAWAAPFQASKTAPAPFTAAAGQQDPACVRAFPWPRPRCGRP
jgi:hypothetical protein